MAHIPHMPTEAQDELTTKQDGQQWQKHMVGWINVISEPHVACRL